MSQVGKNRTRPAPGLNLGHTFTMQMTKQYNHTEINVTVDNWFTSLPLTIDILRNCGMTLLGTIRPNKNKYQLS